MNIAILITSHNRKNITLKCLDNLFATKNINDLNFDVFLVDDGSTDGTSKAIREQYPKVKIINGNGVLYWNQGMRLAWKTAMKHKNYDFYMWLNDDTMIDQDALEHIYICYNESLLLTEKPNIIVGACRNNVTSNNFSYGIRDEHGPIIPNGECQTGKHINGNIVLIAKDIVNSIGILSKFYTHAMGDYDYGLRALENGIELITTKKYIATCATNKGIPKWRDPKLGLLDRWIALHTPLGLNIKEYKIFRKRFWPKNYIMSILKVYLRCLVPSFYNKMSGNAK
tara:strand:- start:2644 stop:3492 length:849 start_codon:yes stop_codon:yes gene_type:complete